MELTNNLKRIDISAISKIISTHFKKDNDLTIIAINKYCELITNFDLSRIESWRSMWVKIGYDLFGTTTTQKYLDDAMSLSVLTAENVYDDFEELIRRAKLIPICDSN